MISVGITGATGFIGQELVKRLVREKYAVSVLIHDQSQKFPRGVKIYKGDLVSGSGIAQFVENLECLIHLAARQVPPQELMFQDNVIATQQLMEKVKLSKISHVIYLSSVAVYGDYSAKKFIEADVCKPTTEYGFTKFLSEQICTFWARTSKKKLTILRPFNIYGPHSSKGVVYLMTQQVKQDKSIVIYGDGKQKRDFLYVDDVVDAICRSVKKKKYGVYNLGLGKNYSLKQLAQLILKISHSRVSIVYKPQEVGKPQNIFYSTQKAQSELGWTAKVPLQKGIEAIFSHE